MKRSRNKRLTPLVARAIMATSAIDRIYELVTRIYQLVHRMRSELVSALASDALLEQLNDLSYDRDAYRPNAGGGREHLFPWEENVVHDRFPSPPARILVGGAGGGREAFALSSMGYAVVAFEPSRPLVEAMAAHVPKGAKVDVRRGGYEQMGQLFGTEQPASFDAAILGWGSFSHLRNDRTRIATLTEFRRLTNGPILVSFDVTDGAISPRLAQLRRILPQRGDRDSGAHLDIGGGLFHGLDADEMRSLASQAGLEVASLYFPSYDAPPYVVLEA
jgi:hypothetical protein